MPGGHEQERPTAPSIEGVTRVSHARRTFLRAAFTLTAGATLFGCDPPASRDRQLPSASDQLGARPPTPSEAGKPVEVKPQPRLVQRPFPPTSEPLVRVRFATVRAPQRVVRIEGEGSRVLVSAGDGSPTKAVRLPATIEATFGGWVVTEAAAGGSSAMHQFVTQSIEVRPESGAKGVRVAKSIADCGSLPWGFRCVARTDEAVGAFDLVSHVPMEQYLPGVLAKELYSTWSLETFTSQAIAARSFACCEIAQSQNSHFDVVAGEASQAWIGVTTHKASLEAVRRTRGMLLLWDKRVVPAYYSSTCGGRPANASDAITGDEFNTIAPLQVGSDMVRECCKNAPAWRWKLTLPLAEASKRIQLWARTERPAMARIDGLRGIEIAASNAAGRPVTFRLLDAKGQTFEIPAERFRWALNADVEGLPTVKSRVKSADFVAAVTGSSVTLNGRGFGHGVGMCQYGAEALSKQGRTWREILSRYYPGTEIFATYEARV